MTFYHSNQNASKQVCMLRWMIWNPHLDIPLNSFINCQAMIHAFFSSEIVVALVLTFLPPRLSSFFLFFRLIFIKRKKGIYGDTCSSSEKVMPRPFSHFDIVIINHFHLFSAFIWRNVRQACKKCQKRANSPRLLSIARPPAKKADETMFSRKTTC